MAFDAVYNASEVEAKIYELWEQNSAFRPRQNASYYFSQVMPPPNANANLHMGHALTYGAIEDLLTRFHRLKGASALLLPGADHAGFETWVVYEKKLQSEGKTRFDFSREELYQQVWDFVDLNKTNLMQQFRKMGVSCDWDNFTFTLDQKVVKTAYHVFKKMWDEKLIYRGERLVNYCTHHGTGFSDYEVDYKETDSKLYYIPYSAVDNSGEIVVATTRPETMLGDVAVAVHPDDKRYTHLIGKTVHLPLTNREIPVIADEMVDSEFGTGAVKITPAHDQNDFEVAKRHDLPFITVISHEGLMNSNVPEKYINLTVNEAREAVLTDLQNINKLSKTENHQNKVGYCYKCGTIIQPLLAKQWFVKMAPLAEPVIKALEAEEVQFLPQSKRKLVINYLKNIHDWNISRQIAWGIPIPAFCNIEDSDDWIFSDQVDQEQLEIDGKVYRRDNDVFDTWFSSGQWPYVTLGWDPEQPSEYFEQFYPLTMMETGGEILYAWVCRMMLMGLYTTGKMPFKTVYIHGNVLAEDGTKMSKSLGNTINPIDVISEYGSDAIRLGLLQGRTPGAHQAFSYDKVRAGRNFCNKLWNIARFVDQMEDSNQTSDVDGWIKSRIDNTANAISSHLHQFQINEAYEKLYELVWNDFADWYIEFSKVRPNKQQAVIYLKQILVLAHPFMPFITEQIWQSLGMEGLLMLQDWPKEATQDDNYQDIITIQSIVTEIRQLSSSSNIAKPLINFQDDQLMVDNFDIISRLTKSQSSDDLTGLKLKSREGLIFVLDQNQLKNYTDRLSTQSEELKAKINSLSGRLNNPGYIQKAPPMLIEESQRQLEEANKLLESTLSELSAIRD